MSWKITPFPVWDGLFFQGLLLLNFQGGISCAFEGGVLKSARQLPQLSGVFFGAGHTVDGSENPKGQAPVFF